MNVEIQKMNAIANWILKDTKNMNERNTVAVILRTSALLFCLYFLCLMIVFCTLADWENALVCLFCLGCYGISFYTTYLNRTKLSVGISQSLMVFWILVFIVKFGWDCGVQHYLFALLVLNFTVSTAEWKSKIAVAVGACAYRLGLYAYTRSFAPYTQLHPKVSVLMQVLNTIFIFSQISAIMIIFAKDSQKMEKKLQKMAAEDPLTGLWNRWSMWEYIRGVEHQYLSGTVGSIAIAIADIDFFKKINDTYGHNAGDQVLTALAELFQNKMTDYGKVCRWGGEEFLFVFYGRTGDEAYTVLTDLVGEIHNMTVPYGEQKIQITLTFGLEEYDKNNSMEEIIGKADQKLYCGKEAGRDRIVY